MRVTANAAGRIIDLGEPWHVRPENGCWQRCPEEDAVAVSVKGTLYALPGSEIDTDALPPGNWAWEDPDDPASGIDTAFVYEREDDALTLDMLDDLVRHSTEIVETETAIAEVYEGQAGISEQTTETQVAIAEVYEGQAALAEQITEIQMAMAEQYEQNNGGES